MPLTVFLILGTLQLSLALQARLMAQYAVFRATRAGSVNYGDCTRMRDAAIASLIPTFDSYFARSGPSAPTDFANIFAAHQANAFVAATDSQHTNDIVWIYREQPLAATVPNPQDVNFDDPTKPIMRLEVRMIYWFPLKIPFANWVMSRMFLYKFGLQSYNKLNPLMPTESNAQWNAVPGIADGVTSYMLTNDNAGQFVLPIKVSYTMRMMTPARSVNFSTQDCPISAARGPPPWSTP